MQIQTSEKHASTFVGEALRAARQFGVDASAAEYSFGSDTLRLVCPSAQLSSIITPTLNHAATTALKSSGSPWTVYALSADEDGFMPPPLQWTLQCDEQELVSRSMFRPTEGIAISSDESRGIWHLMHLPSRTGLYWVKSAPDLPSWELGSPLRHHIHWLCMMSEMHMLHGAVVGDDRWGALLIGPGGSGKSTLTAASVVAGLHTVGDDLVALKQHGTGWSAHALYDVLKLTGMAADVFNALIPHAINPERAETEKALVPISVVAPGRFQNQMSVDAVFSCVLSHEPVSKIERASAFEIIRALSPATSKVLRTGLSETFHSSAQVARSLPCFRFQIGKDPLEAVACLRAFMKHGTHNG